MPEGNNRTSNSKNDKVSPSRGNKDEKNRSSSSSSSGGMVTVLILIFIVLLIIGAVVYFFSDSGNGGGSGDPGSKGGGVAPGGVPCFRPQKSTNVKNSLAQQSIYNGYNTITNDKTVAIKDGDTVYLAFAKKGLLFNASPAPLPYVRYKGAGASDYSAAPVLAAAGGTVVNPQDTTMGITIEAVDTKDKGKALITGSLVTISVGSRNLKLNNLPYSYTGVLNHPGSSGVLLGSALLGSAKGNPFDILDDSVKLVSKDGKPFTSGAQNYWIIGQVNSGEGQCIFDREKVTFEPYLRSTSDSNRSLYLQPDTKYVMQGAFGYAVWGTLIDSNAVSYVIINPKNNSSNSYSQIGVETPRKNFVSMYSNVPYQLPVEFKTDATNALYGRTRLGSSQDPSKCLTLVQNNQVAYKDCSETDQTQEWNMIAYENPSGLAIQSAYNGTCAAVDPVTDQLYMTSCNNFNARWV